MIPLAQASSKFDQVVSHFEEEVKKLRAGRPSPEMFTNIQVEAYGSSMALGTMANITIVDATLVTVSPYDKSLTGNVAKALQQQVNYNPQIDGELIRIPIPQMTQETRAEIVKVLKEKAEEARISVRVARKDVLAFLDHQKKEEGVSEDIIKRDENTLQGLVEKANERIDEISKQKEESLMTV